MKINSKNTNLNLRHLRAAHAIWEEGSFSLAAQRLGVVPSALSETIRQLEESAGLSLFDRKQRPPKPTELGLAFLEETRPLLDGFDRALLRLRESADLSRGSLAIGASPSAISGLLAPALSAFRKAYPGITITLYDEIAERLAQMVAHGKLDLAIAGRAGSSPELHQAEIRQDPFGLACHKDHPLAIAGGPARLGQIDPASLIHLDGDTGIARLLSGCEGLPVPMQQGGLYAHSTIGQLCLIRAGLGVALMPREAVLMMHDPLLAFVALSDFELTRSLYLLTPANRSLTNIAERFVDFLDLEQISVHPAD
nr:LysR family transcriptional regulator [uncultured Cohaesibacter sp.]